MNTKAEIRITRIEEDGTITFETDKIPNELHKSAEEFMKYVQKMMGTEFVTVKLKDSHIHKHEDNHEHKHLNH